MSSMLNDDYSFDQTMRTMRTQSTSILGRIDKYELLERKGGGAFGVVYLARDTFANTDVAIKTLHPLIKHNPEELEEVRRNFQLVADLAHPNIAGVKDLHCAQNVEYFDEATRHDVKVSPGDPVLVLAYAPGVPLNKWKRQFPHGIVPIEQAYDIAAQTAQALDAAHAEKIIHRDIKPENLMIETREDGSLRVRVLDFGLAAEIRSSMGRLSQDTGSTSGTRPYMAPEQWSGKRQDARTDQYALACVLYEMLAGEPPFAGVFQTGDVGIMVRVITTEPPEPIDSLESERNEILRKALSKNKEDRFLSCGEFMDAFADPEAVSYTQNPPSQAAYLPPQVPNQMPAYPQAPSVPTAAVGMPCDAVYPMSRPEEFRNFAWRRWTARLIDLIVGLLLALLLTIGLGLLIGMDEIAEWSEDNPALDVIITTVVSYFSASLVYYCFGTTLGKKINGISVCDTNGVRIDRNGFFLRELEIFVKGMCLCIPFLQAITEIVQYKRVGKGFPASYDQNRAYQAHPTRGKHPRDIVVTVFAVIVWGIFQKAILS